MLVSFLTQSIWTHARLISAGYDVEPQCQCGHDHDNLKHRLLQCPTTADLRQDFTADELETIGNLTDQALAYGFQFEPEFSTGAPEGFGFENAEFGAGTPTSSLMRLSRERFSPMGRV